MISSPFQIPRTMAHHFFLSKQSKQKQATDLFKTFQNVAKGSSSNFFKSNEMKKLQKLKLVSRKLLTCIQERCPQTSETPSCLSSLGLSAESLITTLALQLQGLQ